MEQICQVPVWPSGPMSPRCVPLLGTSVAGNGHSNYGYLWLSRTFSWLSLNQDKELKPTSGLPQQPLIWSPMTCAWTRPTWQILWVCSTERASHVLPTLLCLCLSEQRDDYAPTQGSTFSRPFAAQVTVKKVKWPATSHWVWNLSPPASLSCWGDAEVPFFLQQSVIICYRML